MQLRLHDNPNRHIATRRKLQDMLNLQVRQQDQLPGTLTQPQLQPQMRLMQQALASRRRMKLAQAPHALEQQQDVPGQQLTKLTG